MKGNTVGQHIYVFHGMQLGLDYSSVFFIECQHIHPYAYRGKCVYCTSVCTFGAFSVYVNETVYVVEAVHYKGFQCPLLRYIKLPKGMAFKNKNKISLWPCTQTAKADGLLK